MSDFTTWASAAVIIIVFLLFCKEEYKLYNIKEAIKKLLNNDNILDSLKETKIAPLAETYSKTINIETHDGKKSNIPASEYINDYSVCKYNKLNLRMLDTAAGTLVGLGLLGTFLGLTLGIKGFDSSNTERINESIQGLLAGMGTAFLTSLLGMTFSILFTAADKALRHRLYKDVKELTDKLDSEYYIDDLVLANINQQNIVNQLYKALKNDLQQQALEIANKLTYTNAEGQNVTIGNAIREILTENTKQSKALMSFSTDLAMELNQGFDETLSRQMQQKIVPLMESVDATTKAVVEHIDKMADTVSSPATDMMQNVVDELKQSMQSLLNEFSTGLSGSATSELENLAMQLGTATQAMADFPKNMENISATLQVTIEEVKHAISEISNTSANANSTAMQQMQEQITYATGAISNAITEVKEVMSGISQSSQEQSNQMVSKLADAAEKMGSFLTGTISTLSNSVQQSVKGITDDINSKQTDLIALQEDTTSQTKKLLENFNVGLERLEKMNEYVTGTMNGFKQAQGEITVSTSNLRTISSDMKLATELFNKGQNDYAARLAQLQTASQKGIDQVTEMLKNSGELSDEYVQKFDLIKQGLGSIFSQLQSGLTEYSRTVKDTTDKYLASYTSSLTQTTGALASTIERQNEVTEMLTDTISRYKK
ncbi:MotA/TolQ/ExbB proton channel family protein [Segatella copri]|uniref:MotA/TolQ/ExbB proton channel family protein n=1 Tax=Segatella copri TaxID=165179 RepID=UPI003F89E6A4